MAQPISPMIWNKAALTDNRLLPARYSIGIFTGKGVNIANNEEAYAYDDIIVSDRIFDYDDRRLNGLANYAANTDFNVDGRDGWGASAYGPFQTVRFTRRVFTSGQHKSIAWRIFDEKQYTGDIGEFGTATKSYAYTGGEAYMSTAETINKAKAIWDKEILGPHIDKYNFFAIANGHISGRFVQTHAAEGAMFDCDGTWIASPGPYQGLSFQPEFAPIKAVEWDALNARPLLNAIDVAWTNLFIPEDNRVILLDKAYKDDLLSNLIGVPGTVPQTEKAYDALVEGRFERLYGWDFDFSIPSQYFPKVYVDDNNNVVHSADGTGAYDALMLSIDASSAGMLKLQTELAAAGRQRATNYIGTYWDKTNGKFVNELTNYPLSMPAGAPYYGDAETYTETLSDWEVSSLSDFPWQGWPGQGLDPDDSSYTFGPVGTPRQVQVIGMAVYRPAAQLGEEYGYMETDRGKTRGKFTELVFDMKHDAWVIPNYSHGIILLIDEQASIGTPAVKVELVDNTPKVDPEVEDIETSVETLTLVVGQQAVVGVTVTGEGDYDKTWVAVSSATGKATVDANGVVTGIAAGTANLTFASNGDPTKTATVAVTVSAS